LSLFLPRYTHTHLHNNKAWHYTQQATDMFFEKLSNHSYYQLFKNSDLLSASSPSYNHGCAFLPV
jgi:hypothetical protein